ncbi:MAG TPA: KamA family protein [Bacteroidales bacterium]
MHELYFGDKKSLDVKALRIVNKILIENPEICNIFKSSETSIEARLKLREWVMNLLEKNPVTKNFYIKKIKGHSALKRISFRDYAIIRLMDYLDNEGRLFNDPNLDNQKVISRPVKNLWLAIKNGKGRANHDFFLDMLYLFRQINGKLTRRIPAREKIEEWMNNHPTGLDDDIIEMREENKNRLINKLIEKIDCGDLKSARFQFEPGMTKEEKIKTVHEWWNDYQFHLVFAIRSPELLNEMLDFSLREKTFRTLKKAKKKGIPIFINPYYLSLLSVNTSPDKTGADLTLRDYILPNKELIAVFGQINAWEKEDKVQPGEPNTAGWLLPPYHNVHRRYPEVAILIPDTVGRACGGLCVSCQRMYDFQSGYFNFELEKLKPGITWPEKMQFLLNYWENDSQLRDILITGGDALMSTNASLKKILDEVYNMALRKIKANKKRPKGKKYAEIKRIRLGTRLPVYLPQRINKGLIEILSSFKDKASKIGIKQFVIQTHIQSAMEITPEALKGIQLLISSGWIITNQLVFTAAASRRGHTAKLRNLLNSIGVVPYYTFSVKGFKENYHNFATNERAAQERVEEKYIGHVMPKHLNKIEQLQNDPENIVEKINEILNDNKVPFLATDRTVLNMPGVGKSFTYRTIGITDDGRRILEFEHDHTRNHSPIIDSIGNIIIIESKSINDFLIQMDKVGEDIENYKTIWGYSASETEERMPIFNYPEYDYKITNSLSNFMFNAEQIPLAEFALEEENLFKYYT